MKKVLTVILFSMLFISCTKTIEVREQYEILEVLQDPGDGSGEFSQVESNMKVTIYDDDSYDTDNGSMCSVTNSEEFDSGMFNFMDNTLTTKSCSDDEFQLDFTLESDTLFIYLPCVESCILKFVKVQR